jgi:rhamnogalacturonyl hydrolase YesR
MRIESQAARGEMTFGGERWETIAIPSGGTSNVHLKFAHPGEERLAGTMLRIRLTLAEKVLGRTVIHAVLPQSGERIASFDIRYGYRMQIFEAPISSEDMRNVTIEGVSLVIEEGESAKIVGCMKNGEHTVFTPHLLIGDMAPSIPMFLRHLTGSTAFHPTGWMEGCVLDGMHDIYASTSSQAIFRAIQQHLEAYLHKKKMSPQKAGPRVVNGKIVGDVVEEHLPLAVLSRLVPDHPTIFAAIDFWNAHKQEDSAIFDNETRTITTEGAYTVAYPMAVIAHIRQNEALADLSLKQLLSRRDHLTDANAIYLRRNMDTRATSFRNWNRGNAWYMLGWIKTLVSLQHVLPDIALEEASQEFRRVAELAAKYQDYSGLWHCFWDRQESGLETSGSAGVAAAFAIGARIGLLDASFLTRARLTWNALHSYMSPDGLLTGVAQTNQGGEELQMSGYRTIFPMGMGLVAQLGAELNQLDISFE